MKYWATRRTADWTAGADVKHLVPGQRKQLHRGAGHVVGQVTLAALRRGLVRQIACAIRVECTALVANRSLRPLQVVDGGAGCVVQCPVRRRGAGRRTTGPARTVSRWAPRRGVSHPAGQPHRAQHRRARPGQPRAARRPAGNRCRNRRCVPPAQRRGRNSRKAGSTRRSSVRRAPSLVVYPGERERSAAGWTGRITRVAWLA